MSSSSPSGIRRLGTVLCLLIVLACSLSPAGAVAAPAGAAVPPYRHVVPVLCYHGIHDPLPGGGPDPYSVSPAEFAHQMAMLSAGGFHTISLAQYATFAGGDARALPSRPILITFDDGHRDSRAAADPVLARYGMRATMFVITAMADGPRPGYLGWADVTAMARSGRWDIQEHAGAGHVRIPTGPSATGPFYANLRWTGGRRETFSAFQRRVTGDIVAAGARLTAKVPGFRPTAFAPPYGDYAQNATNYAPIRRWEATWLQQRFRVLFVQDHRQYNRPGSRVSQRYGIHDTTTASDLHDWLVRALPATGR